MLDVFIKLDVIELNLKLDSMILVSKLDSIMLDVIKVVSIKLDVTILDSKLAVLVNVKLDSKLEDVELTGKLEYVELIGKVLITVINVDSDTLDESVSSAVDRSILLADADENKDGKLLLNDGLTVTGSNTFGHIWNTMEHGKHCCDAGDPELKFGVDPCVRISLQD